MKASRTFLRECGRAASRGIARKLVGEIKVWCKMDGESNGR